METSELILNPDVLEFATKAHAGQTRKFTGVPYITHPIEVARIAKSIAPEGMNLRLLEAVALLHDVIEDTEFNYYHILNEFGAEVANRVLILTKRDDDTYLRAILRAKSNEITRIVKLADNIHNSSDLKPGTQKDKYELSKYILMN